ncbi:hypothetical protein [Phreatobacter sp.]|uniref:hypothetical protein n=1 Tax=Phreatobacter sp. TaxID=1966341 RepID=UPI003F70BA81
MAEKVEVKLGGKSAEQVAYDLMEKIFLLEGKRWSSETRKGEEDHADREYVLDLYGECLHAAQGYREWAS